MVLPVSMVQPVAERERRRAEERMSLFMVTKRMGPREWEGLFRTGLKIVNSVEKGAGGGLDEGLHHAAVGRHRVRGGAAGADDAGGAGAEALGGVEVDVEVRAVLGESRLGEP